MRTHSLVALLPSVALLAACAADPVQPRPTPSAPSLAKTAAPIHLRITDPVSATMLGGTCGLTTDVHLTGELQVVITVVQTGTGRMLATINSSAQGTAVGDDGSRYRWSYNNNVRTTDFVGFPSPDNPPYVVNLIDRFRLSGLAGAPDVSSHIFFGIAIDANGNVTILRDRSRNAACDPI